MLEEPYKVTSMATQPHGWCWAAPNLFLSIQEFCGAHLTRAGSLGKLCCCRVECIEAFHVAHSRLGLHTVGDVRFCQTFLCALRNSEHKYLYLCMSKCVPCRRHASIRNFIYRPSIRVQWLTQFRQNGNICGDSDGCSVALTLLLNQLGLQQRSSRIHVRILWGMGWVWR